MHLAAEDPQLGELLRLAPPLVRGRALGPLRGRPPAHARALQPGHEDGHVLEAREQRRPERGAAAHLLHYGPHRSALVGGQQRGGVGVALGRGAHAAAGAQVPPEAPAGLPRGGLGLLQGPFEVRLLGRLPAALARLGQAGGHEPHGQVLLAQEGLPVLAPVRHLVVHPEDHHPPSALGPEPLARGPRPRLVRRGPVPPALRNVAVSFGSRGPAGGRQRRRGGRGIWLQRTPPPPPPQLLGRAGGRAGRRGGGGSGGLSRGALSLARRRGRGRERPPSPGRGGAGPLCGGEFQAPGRPAAGGAMGGRRGRPAGARAPGGARRRPRARGA